MTILIEDLGNYYLCSRMPVRADEGPIDIIIVNERAREMKKDEHTVEVISWRYNLRSGQVANWLIETDWNYDGFEYPLAFEKTVSYLLKLKLLSAEEASNWREKLFVK
jgi:hypothetical protein